MSRFPKPEPEPTRIVGTIMHGAFECDCGEVVTEATHNRQEQRLYWECPEGHSNSIPFRL